MNVPEFRLLDWILTSKEKSRYDFANSTIKGITFSEVQELTGYEIHGDFDLAVNDPFGHPILKDALSDIYGCGTGNIVTSAGGSEANLVSFLALAGPGDEVIVERPGYEPMWEVPEMLGARVVPLERRPEDGFLPDLELLSELVSRRTSMIVLTNLHNPSGVVMRRELVREIADIASDCGAHVLIDEMFLDAADIPERTHAGMGSVLVTCSVSKLYGLGGSRTGWIIADEGTARLCQRAKELCSAASSLLSEIMNGTALKLARRELLSRFRRVADNNKRKVREWMEGMEGILDVVEPDGGIMCFPRYAMEMPSVELGRRLLRERGVLISPGEYFGRDGHFRLTFLNDEELLKEGLEELEKGLRGISGN